LALGFKRQSWDLGFNEEDHAVKLKLKS
jgi:hypothetical protein